MTHEFSAEEQAIIETQGWTDENLDVILSGWQSYFDEVLGRRLTLVEYMQRMINPESTALRELVLAERHLGDADSALTGHERYNIGWRVTDSLRSVREAIWTLKHPVTMTEEG